MILSAHQPNFIPWTGFFHKIASSDVFVILDSVQYPGGKSVANRNKIKTASGVQEIVVTTSVPKGREGKVSYREIAFATGKGDWYKKVLKTIEMSYGKSACFNEYYPYIYDLFVTAASPCEMNIRFIQDIVTKLNIPTQIYLQSEIGELTESNNQMLISLCKHFGAKTYLSGTGAKSYNDESLFNQNNIKLEYQQYQAKPYPQLYGEFVPNLSILDAIMNTGNHALDYIK